MSLLSSKPSDSHLVIKYLESEIHKKDNQIASLEKEIKVLEEKISLNDDSQFELVISKKKRKMSKNKRSDIFNSVSESEGCNES